MADKDTRQSHWAVLIGVGVTMPVAKPGSLGPSKDRSLLGAVQDITAVREHLQAGLTTVDISTLTATKLKRAGAIVPLEAPDSLPSFDNVTLRFKRILGLAQPGDHVYIHYSGHGTRRKADGGVALELIDQRTFATEYLHGEILRNAIYRMVQQGLSVTLVLDCCFSGSVLRTGRAERVAVRYMEHDPDVDAKSRHDDSFAERLDDGPRGGAVTLDRLLDPDGYTILAACSPHEIASELEVKGGAQMGALSYFLVDSLATLRRRGSQVSNQTLHQHLRAQFHACLPEQTPMLYGNRGFAFFGDFSGFPLYITVSVHHRSGDGSLVLNAGQVHGVHQGDEYALSLFDSPEHSRNKDSRAIRVRAYLVGCTDSQLTTVDPQDMERIKNGSVWKATLVTSVSPRKIHMQLGSGVPGRDQLIQAAKLLNFLVLSGPSGINEVGDPMFQVVINAQNDLEVQDHTYKTVRNVAPISCAHDKVDKVHTTKLLSILDHIARYKFFEGIENQLPSPPFESSFRLDTVHEPGKDGFYAVKHGERLVLKFENLAKHPLYLAIFIFTEFWEVRNLASDQGEDTYIPVLPKREGDSETGTEELPLEMSVPEKLQKMGQNQTEDIIKIFVTSQSSTFPRFILPELVQGSQFRGGPDPLQRLQELLQGLGDGPSRTEKNGEFEWTTRSYLVRTHKID